MKLTAAATQRFTGTRLRKARHVGFTGLVGVVLGFAAAAHASTIVFQCGSSVCAIDPDRPGTTLRTLKANATAAGISADGLTAAWMIGGPQRIEEAPLAGGAARTLYAGEIYDYPRTSPSGTKASWTWYYAGYGYFTYVAPNASGGATSIASSTYQTSQGWLGEQPIVGRRGGTSSLARICVEIAGGPPCDQLVASDPTLQIGFPSGSVDGQSVVAVRANAPSSFGIPVEGAIGLYAASSHTWVRNVTSGPSDSFPTFSADGTRVAFVRSGHVWIVRVASGSSPQMITAGTSPFWGGSGTGDTIFRNGFD